MPEWLDHWFTEKELLWVILIGLTLGYFRLHRVAVLLAESLDKVAEELTQVGDKIEELGRREERKADPYYEGSFRPPSM